MSYHASKQFQFKEKGYFFTTIIDIGCLYREYKAMFPRLREAFNLRDDHEDDLYDWLVSKSFYNSLPRIPSVRMRSGFLNNDLYDTIYIEMSRYYESFFDNSVHVRQLYISQDVDIKAMVSGPNLIIAIEGKR